MSKEKQIEEMAVDICLIELCQHLPQEECDNTTCVHCTAEALYNAGYRKQSEGEWIYHECVASDEGAVSGYSCSCCSAFIHEEVYEDTSFPNKYCPNCGAKMKGE